MNNEHHDPLCPNTHSKVVYDDTPCRCEEYPRVREDERRKAAKYDFIADTNDGYADGYAAALRDAVEAVKATYALSWCGDRFNQCDDYEHACQERKQTVAAIEALSGERLITTNDHLVACAYRGWPSMPCDCGLEPPMTHNGSKDD